MLLDHQLVVARLVINVVWYISWVHSLLLLFLEVCFAELGHLEDGLTLLLDLIE